MFLQIAHLISKSGSRIPPRTSHIATGSSLPASQKRHNLSTFPHFTLAIFRTSVYLLASNKYRRVFPIPHETRSRSDKVLTGTYFSELQQKPSMHLPTPNKCNEGSCYIYETRPRSDIKFPTSLSIYLFLYLATYLSSYMSNYLPTYLPTYGSHKR